MSRDLVEFATGLNIPEGPVTTDDGAVIVVEQFIGCLTRLKDGLREVLAQPGGSLNAAALGPDGRFYITNNWHAHDGWKMPPAARAGLGFRSGLLQAVETDGTVVDLYEGCDGEYLVAPSDLVIDSSGWCYFTDYYGHRVFRGRLDGSAIEIVARDVPFANGICLSNDERRLFVSEYRRGAVTVVELLPTNEVGRRRTFAELPTGASPDGLSLDQDGYLLVASATDGSVVVFDPEGYLEEVIPMPDRVVTNLAFGGADFRTVYVTLAPFIETGGDVAAPNGRVLAFRWDRPGLRLHGQR